MRGYVAFLDVLGFTALVSRDHDGAKLMAFSESLKAATEPLEIDFVVFSDSIVLTAKSDAEEAFFAILQACSQLVARLLELGVAMRGAISFGAYERRLMGQQARQESVFVAGGAVIDAYQFEQAQDWVGIMIAPSARERIPDLAERCMITIAPVKRWAPYIQRCSVPFHSPSTTARYFDGFAIVPISNTSCAQSLAENLSRTIARLDWLRSIAPSPEAQEKYQRAIRWLDQTRSQWQNVAENEARSISAGHLEQPRFR